MKKIVLFFVCFFMFIPFIHAAAIDNLEVGSKFDRDDIQNISSYFQSYEIKENDEIYERIYGKSFPTNNEISLKSIRYLKMIYYNYDGDVVVGEMIVHANLANDVLKAFEQLFENHIEIYSMRLVDDFWQEGLTHQEVDELSMESNNTSAFHYRTMTASSNLSNHALGMAIDINPLENPYISGRNVQPKNVTEEYYDPSKRENNNDIHVIKKNDTIYQIFTNLGFTWGGDWQSPKDYQHFEKKVDESVNQETKNIKTSNKNTKTVLLIAGHGAGKDCNHASGSYNGKMYYEVIETRKAVERIAKYLKQNGVKYEIANEIVGDSYWSSDISIRNAARNCINPNADSSCCGFRTASVGTYESSLMQHIDSVGRENYSIVFEIHFNSTPGASYTATMIDKDSPTAELKENSLKLSQAVVDAIGYGHVEYMTEEAYSQKSLRTITQFYTNRSIPTYYMETVFMDTPQHFKAYMEHAEEAAKAIADVLTELAPESTETTSNKNHKNNGRFVDPYPNIFGKVNLEPFEDYGCDTLFFNEYGEPTELKNFMDDLFFLVRLAVPIVILAWSTVDYIVAILSGEQDKVKKVTQKTMKRIMIGLVIFFLPYFLDLLFHLFGLYDLSKCGIGV